MADCEYDDEYYSVDLTDILLNKKQGVLRNTDGLLLKTIGEKGFSVIPTFDSYYAPQILEIKYIN